MTELIVLGGIVLASVLVIWLGEFIDARKFNGGCHRDCGGEWKYLGECGGRADYQCDKCKGCISCWWI